jgi:hypothetical protein
MFSELLFLRFCDILDQRFDNLLTHLDEGHSCQQVPHSGGPEVIQGSSDLNLSPGGRPCCVDYCNNIFKVFLGINKVFGGDLLVAVFILISSITFGLYLVLTYIIFVGVTTEPVLFTAYIMYSFIPSLRWVFKNLSSFFKGMQRMQFSVPALKLLPLRAIDSAEYEVRTLKIQLWSVNSWKTFYLHLLFSRIAVWGRHMSEYFPFAEIHHFTIYNINFP